MARPRLGLGADGLLFPGRLPRLVSRLDHKPWLSVPALPGSVSALIPLMGKADIAIFPLWPARGAAHFLSRWIKRRFADAHADRVEELMAAIEICDRAPEDLDAIVDVRAPTWDPAEALDWTRLEFAMQRGWALAGDVPTSTDLARVMA